MHEHAHKWEREQPRHDHCLGAQRAQLYHKIQLARMEAFPKWLLFRPFLFIRPGLATSSPFQEKCQLRLAQHQIL